MKSDMGENPGSQRWIKIQWSKLRLTGWAVVSAFGCASNMDMELTFQKYTQNYELCPSWAQGPVTVGLLDYPLCLEWTRALPKLLFLVFGEWLCNLPGLTQKSCLCNSLWTLWTSPIPSKVISINGRGCSGVFGVAGEFTNQCPGQAVRPALNIITNVWPTELDLESV